MSTPSPKLRPQSTSGEWYPYYAGFSEAFALSVVTDFLPMSDVILDPWNGAGTTTFAAASRGVASYGVDLNPALALIARARIVPKSIGESLDSIGAEIVEAAARDDVEALRDTDPIAGWLKAPAAQTIRSLQRAIHTVTDDSRRFDQLDVSDVAGPSTPVLTSFYYTALFSVMRRVLSDFRGTNPTWVRRPASHNRRKNPSYEVIRSLFRSEVRQFKGRLALTGDETQVATEIVQGDFLSTAIRNDSFTGCLTSPPYATRLDYVKASIPELVTLGLTESDLENLRSAMTGTPLVRDVERLTVDLVSDEASRILRRIEAHQSHGSANYYAPWLRSYLTQLTGACQHLDLAVHGSGRIALVVQDSYYKAIRIDLQTILEETFGELGRRLVNRIDYQVRNNMASLNRAAAKHLPARRNHESLLVFA